jgi:hypothetical protein
MHVLWLHRHDGPRRGRPHRGHLSWFRRDNCHTKLRQNDGITGLGLSNIQCLLGEISGAGHMRHASAAQRGLQVSLVLVSKRDHPPARCLRRSARRRNGGHKFLIIRKHHNPLIR